MTTDLYLDYNASTPVHPEVRELCRRFLESEFANPSAGHAAGRHVRGAIDAARATIARSIGAEPDEIWITSGGTEANNWALLGSVQEDDAAQLVTNSIEHKSILATARHLESRGRRVARIGVDRAGSVRLEELERALRDDTALVSIMLANNETGVLQPIDEVAELCRRRGVRLHVDAVCALGRVPVDVRALGCDLLTLGSHKLYAPKGCGVLFVRRGTRLAPLIHGCGQQGGMRAGTENALVVCAFARALELLQGGALPAPAELATLRDALWQRLATLAPEPRRNGEGLLLCNTLNVTFPGARAWELVAALARDGISVSAGASAAGEQPSHVLLAMGLSPEDAAASLRFSLGSGTTMETIERVHESLMRALQSAVPAAVRSGA